MKILVSNCLLGVPCRYKGDGVVCARVNAFLKKHVVIGVCPEVAGGLPIPRDPAEIVNGKLISNKGRDVTEEYMLGAQTALALAKQNGVDMCLLKAKSPSCGSGKVYDGTFTGTLVAGDGVTSALLKANGYAVLTEADLEAMTDEEFSALCAK